MEIVIDLSGLNDASAVMHRFNENLGFGTHPNGKPVGVGNWDAFEDCMRCLDGGGIYGTGRMITFPCTLLISGHEEFARRRPEEFSIFTEILESKSSEYENDGLDLRVLFMPKEHDHTGLH